MTRQDELGNDMARNGLAATPLTEAAEASTLFDVDQNTPKASSPRSSTGGVDIFTDGACSGNPGPGGWGAVLRHGRHEKTIYGGEAADTTNNRMELLAAIKALEALTRPSVVRLHTDSQYLRAGISGWLMRWKRNGWKTTGKKPVKNVDLWQRLDALASGHDIEWLWVRGHAGHPDNELADRLANRGLAEARTRPHH